ncbi:MAG: hypothetical protein PUC65_11170 [Clostridiales bacterium]|nr:hypothetical protein [Clostridiales bacterium]
MNRKIISWIMLVLGGIAAIAGMVVPSLEKRYGGAIFGIGFTVFFFGLDYLVNRRYDQKHPKEAKQKQIEIEDERNKAIRFRAKAVSGDVVQWLIMAAAYCNIIADGALWLTLLMVGIFTLRSILDFVLRAKYEKTM